MALLPHTVRTASCYTLAPQAATRSQVVHSGEGPVQSIAIAGPMLAWANDLGVKVYDAQHGKRVSYVERAPGSPPPRLFRTHLKWESSTELIIGCAVRVCGMRACRARKGTAPTGPRTGHRAPP